MSQNLLAALFIILSATTLHADKRPNILFIFADDWGRFASCYAACDSAPSPNLIVKTPNIDRVAARGVLFRNAFVNAPSCTPCRSSLLTGQYFWRTGRGAILHAATWDSSIPTFPLLLRDAGYQIGKYGKVWSPGQPVDAPFDRQRYAFERAGKRFSDFSENATKLISQGESFKSARAQLLAEVAGNFKDFLADRNADTPFLYWFGSTNVHRRWVRGTGKSLWEINPDDLKGKLPPFLPDVPEVREDFADYLGEIQALDAGIGRLLAELETAGALDDTIIIISGDHGPPGFPRGKCNLYDFGTAVSLVISGPGIPPNRIVDDFTSLPDLAPTILDFAKVAIPSVMTGRSLVPILHSDKNGPVDPSRTYVLSGRERHVAHAREVNLPYPQRALRTKDYLYIINFKPERWPLGEPYNLADDKSPSPSALSENTYATFRDMDASPTKSWLVLHRDDPKWKPLYDLAFVPRPREELYVLADDPYQINNVAADPNRQEIRRALEEELLSRLRETGDPRVTEEGKLYESPPFTDPPPKSQL